MTSYDRYTCDVLCLGGGGAAVTAAVTAANHGATVVLVSKEPVGYGDTRISMGMIVYPGVARDDSIGAFYEDLLKSGEYINDAELALIMAQKARRAAGIVEGFGHLLQRDATGNISADVANFSGGHSAPRTLSCPPSNGVGMGNALRATAARSNVRVLEETTAYRLVTDGERVTGAVCFDLVRGRVVIIDARTVIIATGGAGWLYYPHTDCEAGATGDGYALAYRAGADLVDMEQVQFVPFAITHPSSMCGIFIGDPAIAGPRGVLRNGSGDVILDKVHSRARAEVARVMAFHLSRGEGTAHGGLLLDLSPNLAAPQGRDLWERRNRLGQMNAIRIAYGEKAYRWEEPWDVAPTAHYNMGGVRVNRLTQSSVRGLYAVGQAMGGVFGADRLGSVSLAEIFVFGEIAGEEAAREAKNTPLARVPEATRLADELAGLTGRNGRFPPIQLKRRLQKVMWEKVGIARHRKGLEEALAEIAFIKEAAPDVSIAPARAFNADILDAIELRHMLDCAEMITRSALAREETRGAHVRLDYPDRDDSRWKCNVVARNGCGGMEIETRAVKLDDRTFHGN